MNFLVLITIIVSVHYIEAQSSCTTPSGSEGQCILLTSCNKLFILLRQSDRPEIAALLKNSFCGGDGDAMKVKVCCELERTTTSRLDSPQNLPTGSRCSTPRGRPGRCLLYSRCPEISAIIVKPNQTAAEKEYAKQSFCGYEDAFPKVCCDMSPTAPKTPDRTLTNQPPTSGDESPEIRVQPLSSSSAAMVPCETPRNYDGNCVEIQTCPELHSVWKKADRSNGENSFLRRSFCGHNGKIAKVCCQIANQASSSRLTSSKSKNECMLNDDPPTPSSGCCGRDGLSGNKITGGAPTNLDQYPWLALLEYEEGSGVATLCGGTLISRRYVLTAAHCIKSRSIARRSLKNVRLGEYDTRNIIDSLETEGGGEDFSDKLVIIAVESVVIHEDYSADDVNKRNDIALIRLASPAPYTDFIRPICLPTSDTTVNRDPKYVLYAAGWGRDNVTSENNPIKNFVDLPYIDADVCQAIFAPGTRREVLLWERQLCAGGEMHKDACKGDSGGPLMYENGAAYEIIGITSFGTDVCGEGVPGIYTKVFPYLNWIRSNIK